MWLGCARLRVALQLFFTILFDGENFLKQTLPHIRGEQILHFCFLFKLIQCHHVEEEGISGGAAVVVEEEVVAEVKRQADSDLIDDLMELDLRKMMGMFNSHEILFQVIWTGH